MTNALKKSLDWTQFIVPTVLSLFALLALNVAISGVLKGDLYIPSGRAAGRGIHFYGLSAWLMAGAITCGAASAVYHVVRCFGKPYEKKSYRYLRLTIRSLGWCLLIAALVVRLGFASTR